jgi:hypothetical protein
VQYICHTTNLCCLCCSAVTNFETAIDIDAIALRVHSHYQTCRSSVTQTVTQTHYAAPYLHSCLYHLFSALRTICLIPLNREVAEPAVTVSNLPADYTEAQVLKLFELYKPVRVEMTNGELETEALVVLGGPADVDLAVNAMGR